MGQINSLQLKAQDKSILNSAEQENEISTVESVLAGLGSGLIQIPKGVFSLGASLMDLGADTNKAAQVEKYFDDLTEWDEKAQSTTAGKIAELLVNIGIPGGVGFKVGMGLANKALTAQKAGTYFKIAGESGKKISKTSNELAKLNVKGRTARFAVGAITGGAAEGIFVGDVEDAGTFGELLGGPTRLHRTIDGDRDPARDLLNRVKFGTEGALFTGLVGGLATSLKTIAKRDEALRFADNKLDKGLFKFGTFLQKEGGTSKEFFKSKRQMIGRKYADINAAQQYSRQLNKKIDGMFPWMQRMFDTATKTQRQGLLKVLNDGLISGTPKVSSNGTVSLGNMGSIHRNKAVNFLKKNKISFTKEHLANIFSDMESIRSGWGTMFSLLGKDIKQLSKSHKQYKSAFNDYKKIFSTKFKDYLGATYDVFQNRSLVPMFTKPVSTEVADKAAAVFMKSARAAGTPITWQEALTAVDNVAKTAKAPKNFNEDVRVFVPEFFTSKSAANKVATREFEINQLSTDKRKLIEEILGKTRDPVQTILAATGEVSAVTRRNQLLADLALQSTKALRTKGVRSLLYENEEQIFKKSKELGDSWDRSMYRKIQGYGKASGIENPTVGKWALNEVADAIELASGKTVKGAEDIALYRNLILFPKATSQMAKTILSTFTHVRNFVSAGAFAAANGIIPDPRNISQAWKSLQVAAPGTRQFNDFYRKMTKLGVVNTSVRAQDLQALMKDVDFGSIVGGDRALRGMFKFSGIPQAKRWLQDAYTAEDDFWKITTFLGERGRLGRAYENAGVKFKGLNKKQIAEKLDEEAAEIVRNNVPNYDYVSDFVKTLRKFPVGNFVSFPAEILRTSTNILKQGLKEINYTVKVGGKDVKPLAAIGWQRLMGMGLTTAAVPYGAVKLGQWAWDVSNEELMALKKFVAPWSKNSTIIPIKTEDGEFKYIDFSHANAYDTLTRPWQAAINQAAEGKLNQEGIMNNFVKGALSGFGDIASPFVSESIYTEALANLSPIFGRGGKTAEGYEIYNPEDTWGNIAKKSFWHLIKTQSPGSIKGIGRIDYAIEGFDTPFQTGELGPLKWGKLGKYDENGQSYELLDEGLGIVGARAIKINLPRTLKFKQAEYAQRTRKSRSLFTKIAFKEGVATPEDLIDGYINANRALFLTQRDMSENIRAAKTLNISPANLYESLARIPRQSLGMLNANIFQPYRISNTAINTISKNSRKLGKPNPFFEVVYPINSILQQLYRLGIGKGSKFPDFINPFKVEPVSALPKAEEVLTVDQTMPATTGNDLSGLQSNAGNTGQVNQMSGLTRTQEALLSPDEKLIAQGQNQRKGMTS